MPVRVLGDDGGGSIDDVARGIDWAREHGADVINLSLGSEVPLLGAGGGDSFDAAIRRAIAAGIVVVAAAGNNGVPVCEQPAARDGLLCVGAVDKRRARSFFSSFGSGLGFVAPGGSGATGRRRGGRRGRPLHLRRLDLPRARGHLPGRAARRGRRGAARLARRARAGGGAAAARHGDGPRFAGCRLAVRSGVGQRAGCGGGAGRRFSGARRGCSGCGRRCAPSCA